MMSRKRLQIGYRAAFSHPSASFSMHRFGDMAPVSDEKGTSPLNQEGCER